MRKFLFTAAAIAAFSIPAHAGVMVVGGSLAKSCFEAADNRNAAWGALTICDDALMTGLTDGDRVATHVNRGIIRLRVNMVEAAIEDMDAAIARDPNEPEAYFNKGVALSRNDSNLGEAERMFSLALDKKTRKPAEAYYARAFVNEMQGDVRAAYRDYREASRLAPKWAEPVKDLKRFQVRSR